MLSREESTCNHQSQLLGARYLFGLGDRATGINKETGEAKTSSVSASPVVYLPQRENAPDFKLSSRSNSQKSNLVRALAPSSNSISSIVGVDSPQAPASASGPPYSMRAVRQELRIVELHADLVTEVKQILPALVVLGRPGHVLQH